MTSAMMPSKMSVWTIVRRRRGPALLFGAQGFPDVQGHLAEPAGIHPLVVVPGDDLHEVAVDDLGEFQVDDGRVLVLDEVRGYQRLFGYREDAFPARALRCLLEERVDLLGGGLLLEQEREIGERADGYRHAQREAVEQAL